MMNNYYLCVLDFEATCTDKNEFSKNTMEIIEFPSMLYKVMNNDVVYVSEFRKYVKPTINPKLTEFCIELTKITQEIVDNSDTFDIVYNQHIDWIHEHVPAGERLIFATCGHWDLSTMLPRELENKKLKYNNIYNRYINIKDEFKNFYNIQAGSMQHMMKILKIPIIGQLHSGYDDTKNMSKVIIKMINENHNDFKIIRRK